MSDNNLKDMPENGLNIDENTAKKGAVDIDLDDVVIESDDTLDDSVLAEDSAVETVKKLRLKLKEAVEEKQKYLNSWQKDKADFLNIRKRDDEAKNEFLKFAEQGLIEDILPVMDSFDSAMNNPALENVSVDWKKGLENICQQLHNILSKRSVKQFGEKGDVFDPNMHHSISVVNPENDSDLGKVAEVLQKGYNMSGKVIRPALVKVFEK